MSKRVSYIVVRRKMRFVLGGQEYTSSNSSVNGLTKLHG